MHYWQCESGEDKPIPGHTSSTTTTDTFHGTWPGFKALGFKGDVTVPNPLSCTSWSSPSADTSLTLQRSAALSSEGKFQFPLRYIYNRPFVVGQSSTGVRQTKD